MAHFPKRTMTEAFLVRILYARNPFDSYILSPKGIGFFFTSPPLFGTFYLPGEVTLKWGEVSFIGGEVLRGAVTFVGGEVITEILNDSGRGQGKSRRREGIYWEVCYSI